MVKINQKVLESLTLLAERWGGIRLVSSVKGEEEKETRKSEELLRNNGYNTMLKNNHNGSYTLRAWRIG